MHMCGIIVWSSVVGCEPRLLFVCVCVRAPVCTAERALWATERAVVLRLAISRANGMTTVGRECDAMWMHSKTRRRRVVVHDGQSHARLMSMSFRIYIITLVYMYVIHTCDSVELRHRRNSQRARMLAAVGSSNSGAYGMRFEYRSGIWILIGIHEYEWDYLCERSSRVAIIMIGNLSNKEESRRTTWSVVESKRCIANIASTWKSIHNNDMQSWRWGTICKLNQHLIWPSIIHVVLLCTYWLVYLRANSLHVRKYHSF